MTKGMVRQKKAVRIGDREYIFSQLTMGDMFAFNDWARLRIEEKRRKERDIILESAPKIANIDPKDVLEKISRPVTQDEITGEAETMEGLYCLIWLSLMREQPDMRYDEVVQLVQANDLEEVMPVIFGRYENEADGSKKKKMQGRT